MSMRLTVLSIVLGAAAIAHADDDCATRRLGVQLQMRQAPPGKQLELERELPMCDGPNEPTPPLSGARVAGETFVGSLAGVGGAFLGGFIGYKIDTANGCHGEFCGLRGLPLGGGAGLLIAIPAAVYRIRSPRGRTRA